MANIETPQIEQFGKALLVIMAYVLIGYVMQRAAYLVPVWYNKSELKRNTQFRRWFREQYQQLLIFIPIKYIGNFLYYIVLPLQYFQILSTYLTAYQPVTTKEFNKNFFPQNLLICFLSKMFLLFLAAIFSIFLFYSRKRKSQKNKFGILTNEYDVNEYMQKYRQCLLHDHPLAKCCVFGLFLTSTYDIAIGIPLIQSIFPLTTDEGDDDSDDEISQDYTQYIYLYNLIQLMIIVPFCLLLLDIAIISVQKKYNMLKQQEIIIKKTMASERKESAKKQQQQLQIAQTNKQTQNDADADGDNDVIPMYNDDDDDIDFKEQSASLHLSSNPLSPVIISDYLSGSIGNNNQLSVPNDYDNMNSDSENNTPTPHRQSGAISVFLSSIHKQQEINQELQQQQEIQRINRLSKLANLPIDAMDMDTSLNNDIDDGDLSPIEYGDMITPQNTDRSEYNAPYSSISDNQTSINHSTKKSHSLIRRTRTRNRNKTKNKNKNKNDNQTSIPIESTLNNSNSLRLNNITSSSYIGKVVPGSSNDKKDIKYSLFKKLIVKILWNPIIIASLSAFTARAFVSNNFLMSIQPYLLQISSIYEFLALYIVGSLLAVIVQQRKNIFLFAATSHQTRKHKILITINKQISKTKYYKYPTVNHDQYGEPTTSNNDDNPDDNDIFRGRKETNIWTYTESAAGSIAFRKKTVTQNELDQMMKSHQRQELDNMNAVKTPSSISLMNTDNVMMWWWSLSFVLLRYFIASLSYRFISIGIYNILPLKLEHELLSHDNIRGEWNVANYLYGTLTPNILPLIISMKYNIYVSFITISYIISLIMYPLIVFCGLLLFTGVSFPALISSVRYIIFSMQFFSVCAAFIVLCFWFGFKHWRTSYPITIFMFILILQVIYNSLYFSCEYIEYYIEHSTVPLTLYFIVYFLREYSRLVLLSAAFQSCILISAYNVLKKELFIYHRIIQPLLIIFAMIITLINWFLRYDHDNNKYYFNVSLHYKAEDFSKEYFLKCQFKSKTQVIISLIIQIFYSVLLFIMFYYILRKRYQYEMNESKNNKKPLKSRSILLQCFFCCYAKCCSSCSSDSNNKRNQNHNKNDKDFKEPLLNQKDNVNNMINDDIMIDTQVTQPNKLVKDRSASITSSVLIELSDKNEQKSDNQYNNPDIDDEKQTDPNGLPQVLLVDGKLIDIHSDFHSSFHNINPISENVEDTFARIDSDPTSLEVYYQFDYYAYTLIIYCIALISFIANLCFIGFLIHTINASKADSTRIPELLMLLSVFQHGQTFLIAILFLTTKPIKRLTKYLWQNIRIKCLAMSQNIKDKVNDDGFDKTDDDDDDDNYSITDGYSYHKTAVNTYASNTVMHKHSKLNKTKLPRQFYQKLPILW